MGLPLQRSDSPKFWEGQQWIDRVVGDPVRQDNDKTNYGLGWTCLVCSGQFGALPAAAEQLFNTKLRSRPKIEPNFEALSWFFPRKSHKIRTNTGV